VKKTGKNGLEFLNKKSLSGALKVVGIDPGSSGAVVGYDGKNILWFKMPLNEKNYSCVKTLIKIFNLYFSEAEIFLEEAKPYGMNAKGAFTYGKGVGAIESALTLVGLTPTLVAPSQWTKWAHQGTDRRLNPKERTLEALKGRYPHLVSKVPTGPRSGRLDEGILDALILSIYGYEQLQDAFIDI